MKVDCTLGNGKGLAQSMNAIKTVCYKMSILMAYIFAVYYLFVYVSFVYVSIILYLFASYLQKVQEGCFAKGLGSK